MNKIIIILLFLILYIILYKLDKKFQLIYKISKKFKIPDKWIPFTFLCIAIITFIVVNSINLNSHLLKIIELTSIIPFTISTRYLYKKN